MPSSLILHCICKLCKSVSERVCCFIIEMPGVHQKLPGVNQKKHPGQMVRVNKFKVDFLQLTQSFR